MGQTAARRGVGRPPRGVKRRQWNPSLQPSLSSALEARAQETGVACATYCELVVSRAHGYTSDRIEKIDVLLAMAIPGEELQRRTKLLSPGRVLHKQTGSPRPVIVDEPLADEIVKRAATLGVSIADYIRTIYSEAVGRGVADVHQDELDFTDQDHARGEVRLAS